MLAAPSVERVLHDHGAEIFGWLLATTRSDDEAADAYSLFTEDVWRSLARYQGRCSMRTWCYMLARGAIARTIDARSSRRSVGLSQAPASCFVAPPTREPTAGHLRTDVKQRVRSLREQLDPDDQALLVLRVDKDLGWRDIAIVMFGADLAEAELDRRAAALRKRFERVKHRLRALAVTA